MRHDSFPQPSLRESGIAITRLPIRLFPPPNSVPFHPDNYVALGAIGTDTVIVTLNVPAGFNGVINQIGNNLVGAGFNDGSGSLIWRLKQNQNFVKNFEAMLASLGTPVAPTRIDPINIYEGDVVQLIGSNISLAVAGQLLGGVLGGYFYPDELTDEEIWY